MPSPRLVAFLLLVIVLLVALLILQALDEGPPPPPTAPPAPRSSEGSAVPLPVPPDPPAPADPEPAAPAGADTPVGSRGTEPRVPVGSRDTTVPQPPPEPPRPEDATSSGLVPVRIDPPKPELAAGSLGEPVAAGRLPERYYRLRIEFAWSSDGKKLAWCCEAGRKEGPGWIKSMGWLETETGKSRWKRIRQHFVSTAHLGRRLEFGPEDKRLLLLYGPWVLTVDPVELKFTPKKRFVSGVADFAVRGKHLYVAETGRQGGLRKCDAATGKQLDWYPTLQAGDRISMDRAGGRAVLHSGWRHEFSLMDVAAGGYEKEYLETDLKLLSQRVRRHHLRISPDGTAVAATNRSGSVSFFRFEDGKPLRDPLVTGTGVESLDWFPDGDLLAVGHGGRFVTVLDVESGEKVARLHFPARKEEPQAEDGAVTPRPLPVLVRFSPDGRFLAVLLHDGSLVVSPWKAE